MKVVTGGLAMCPRGLGARQGKAWLPLSSWDDENIGLRVVFIL